MSDIDRKKSINIINKYGINHENSTKIEDNIFKLSKNDLTFYNNLLYETLGGILNKQNTESILLKLNNNEYKWNRACFNNSRHKLQEQDDFIENPFEVEEGVLQCKCGSKKVFSYSKQTRSADEPMTTYATCVICNSSWIYNG